MPSFPSAATTSLVVGGIALAALGYYVVVRRVLGGPRSSSPDRDAPTPSPSPAASSEPPSDARRLTVSRPRASSSASSRGGPGTPRTVDPDPTVALAAGAAGPRTGTARSGTATQVRSSPAPSAGADADAAASPQRRALPPGAQAIMGNEGLVHRLVLEPGWRLPAASPPDGVSWDEPPHFESDPSLLELFARQSVGPAERSLFGSGGGGAETVAHKVRRSPSFWAMMLGVVPLTQHRRGGRASGSASPAADSPARYLAVPARRQNLLNAFLEIRDGLSALTPHRADLQRELEQHMDVELWRRMLAAGHFGRAEVLKVVSFLGARVAAIEAPVHSESTKHWLQAARAAAEAPGTGSEAGAGTGARTSSGTSSGTSISVSAAAPAGGDDSDASSAPFGDCPPEFIPRVVSWLFFKLDQIRIDTANFHLSVMAPYLASGGKGAEYEKQRFEALREAGQISTDGIKTWLRQTLHAAMQGIRRPSFNLSAAASPADGESGAAAANTGGDTAGTLSAAAMEALVTDEQRRAYKSLARDDRHTRVFVASEGVLRLVRQAHALSRVAMASAFEFNARREAEARGLSARLQSKPLPYAFPESLRLDVVELERTQNALQRIALSAGLVASVKMVLAEALAEVPGASLARIRRDHDESSSASAVHARDGAASGSGSGSGSSELDSGGTSARERTAGLVGVRSLPQLCRRLDAWLRSEDVTLLLIQDSLGDAAQRLAVEATGEPAYRLPPPTVVLLRTMVKQMSQHSHVLFSQYLDRCIRVLRLHLSSLLAIEADALDPLLQQGPRADPLLTPGLEQAQDELRAIAGRLARVIAHNQHAFGAHYRELLREIASEF